MNTKYMPRVRIGWLKPIQDFFESLTLLQLAKVLVSMAAAYLTGAFLYVTLKRMAYPFGLEWLEGASLIQVQRLLTGHPLYARPSLDYIALIYPPLYFYASALLARLIGLSFLPLRLVSWLSTLGCALVIGLWVRKRSGTLFSSLMAAATFLASFKIVGFWFDIARVDMLALFLMLLAIYLVEGRTRMHLILAGVAYSLACLTKQTYWFMAPSLLIYAFSVNRFGSLVLAVTAIVVSSGVHLWQDALYQGWYSFFVYHVAFGQSSELFSKGLAYFFLTYWNGPVLKSLPLVFPLGGLYLFRQRREVLNLAGLLALAAGAVAFSWLGIVNVGGYKNVLLPSYAIMIMLSWLFLNELLRSPAVPNVVRSAALLAYAAQLLYLRYPPSAQIPSAADLQAGQALVEQLRTQPGEVYVPYDNYLSLLAGKRAFANYTAQLDLSPIIMGISTPEWRAVNSQLQQLTTEGVFSLVILDQRKPWPALSRCYEAVPIKYAGNAFMPVTGWQWKPIVLYTPTQVPSSCGPSPSIQPVP